MEAYHLQDNFSKAVLAAEIVDRELQGAEQKKYVYHRHLNRQLERDLQDRAVEVEERPDTETINQDGRRRQRQRKSSQEPGTGGGGEEIPDETYTSDLRLRREEDDKGKGDRLDMTL